MDLPLITNYTHCIEYTYKEAISDHEFVKKNDQPLDNDRPTVNPTCVKSSAFFYLHHIFTILRFLFATFSISKRCDSDIHNDKYLTKGGWWQRTSLARFVAELLLIC